MSETPRPEKLARPNQLKALTQDQLVAALLRLTMEISVLRDRLRTQENLLVDNGVLGADAIDRYEPSAEESALRGESRAALIQQLINDLSE